MPAGNRFTVQTEVVKGEDYVLLKVFNVDEVRIRDLVLLLDDVKHAVSCRCFGGPCRSVSKRAANGAKGTT